MDQLVSIVIPCFNAEACVGHAINSALRQTYAKCEVIVVDDGSQDRSLSVIREFGSAISWDTGPNRGGSGARNRGVSLARGEFVQFLDADDTLLPMCVEVKLHATNAHPDLCLCCDWFRDDGRGEVTVQHPSVCGVDPVVELLSGQVQTSSPVHRRENLLRVGGFDETLPCSQERDLHLRLACLGVSFARIEKPLFTVRRRRGSVSDDYVGVLLQHERIFCGAAENLSKAGKLTPERRFAFAAALASDGRRLFHRGKVEEARRCWVAAASLDREGSRSVYRRTPTRALVTVFGAEVAESALVALRNLNRALLGSRP
jgi:glycosyltransferase involved in cell wall biosynthesis